MTHPAPAAPDREFVFTETLFMLELGFRAFPCEPNGKRPLTKNGFKDAQGLEAVDGIRKWIFNPGHVNVGLVYPKGLLEVLGWDLDGGNGRGESWKSVWVAETRRLGPLPTTLTSKTPSGGRHLFFEWDVATYGPRPKAAKLLGWTTRWPGDGYVIGPGSTVDGVTYVSNHASIVKLPEGWARAALAEGSGGKLIRTDVAAAGLDLPESIGEGERYEAVRTLVAKLYNRGLNADFIWPIVRDQLAPRFTTPLPETDLRERFDRTWDKIGERLGPPLMTPDVVEAKAERIAEVQTAARYADLFPEQLPAGTFPEDPDPVAFEGLLGDCIGDIEAYTSASRVGLLASMLSIAGAIVATRAEYHGSQTSSFMTSLVGDSAVGRKSTAMNDAWRALTADNALTPPPRLKMGQIGSGESLVRRVSNDAKAVGFARVLVYLPELSETLTTNTRLGATVSQTIRYAFDGQQLANSASQLYVDPEQYQLGMLGAITPDELRDLMKAGSEMKNGFANRILWVPVVGRADRALQGVPRLSGEHCDRLKLAIQDATANRHNPVEIDGSAFALLDEYSDWVGPIRGVVGNLGRRLAVIACRIALVHASLEIASRADDVVVTRFDVLRGIALAEYCRSGLAWVFGPRASGSTDAETALRVLLTVGEPMKRSELGVAGWGRSYQPGKLTSAVDELEVAGLVTVDRIVTAGRPAQVISVHPSALGFRRFSGLIPELSEGARARTREGHPPETVPLEAGGGGGTGTDTKERAGNKGRERVEEEMEKSLLIETNRDNVSLTIKCYFYREHQSVHVIRDGRAYCPACEEPA